MTAASFRAAQRDLLAALNLLGPYRGRCGLCSGVDARHRVADAVSGMVAAGETAEVVADEFGVPLEVVETLARVVPDAHHGAHGVRLGRALKYEEEVWADTLERWHASHD